MERLTERHYKKSTGYYMKCSEYCEREESECFECERSDEIVDRLGAIEDILGDDYDLDRLRELLEACKGLEPSEIAESKLLIATRKDPEKLARMAGLVEADRDGRCVVLPCKLHDKVFFIENGCVKETEVYAFHNWTSGRWKISTRTNRMFDYWKGYEIDFSGIGKTVFLTREAAEAELKRLTD